MAGKNRVVHFHPLDSGGAYQVAVRQFWESIN